MYCKQIAKNKYQVYIYLPPDYDGKRKRKCKTFTAKNKKELDEQVAKWEETLTPSSGTLKTVTDMCNEVWSQVVANKSPNTVHGYQNSLNRINKGIGSLQLEQLSPRMIQRWVNSISRKLSPKTIRDTYSVLNLCCTVAVNWELIAKNPCHDVILPNRNKKEVQILTKEQFGIFCANLDKVDFDTRVLFELALFGSLRRGEILGIYEDEIPENGVFEIKRSRYKIGSGDSFEKSPKTNAGERLCILPKPVVDDVMALREHHAEQKRKYGDLWGDSEYLIKELDGTAFHPNNAAMRLNRYLKKIDLPHITFHALRHTYASMCISLGVDPVVVSQRMGHSNVTTTLSIYTHLFKNAEIHDDKIANLLGDLFNENR
jgi:integrase